MMTRNRNGRSAWLLVGATPSIHMTVQNTPFIIELAELRFPRIAIIRIPPGATPRSHAE